MKKFLLCSAVAAGLALASPAKADLITVSATVDAFAPVVVTSLGLPTLSIGGAVLPDFSFNQGDFNSKGILPAGGVLTSNTINLQQVATGSHTLVLDVTATGLSGPNSLQSILNSFSVSFMTPGWTVEEQTFINGVLQADTGIFSGSADSASSFSSAFLGTTFTAEEKYTIMSNGLGGFNGGIGEAIAAVPEPSTWAMMLLGFVGITFMGMRRRSHHFA